MSDIQIYTDSIKEAIEAVPDEYIEMSEKELAQKVNPTLNMYEIKRAFWKEFMSAQKEVRSMRVSDVYRGIMTNSSFYKLIKNPLAMAWITAPLVSYEVKTKAALDKATERYEELINMEITTVKRIKDEFGDWKLVEETDPKKAAVLLQAIKNLEDRVKGTSIQRQVNVHTSKPDGSGKESATLNMEVVENRLKELEQRLHGGSDERETGEMDRDSGNDCDYIEAEVKRVEVHSDD